jgi:hypothetical protein
VETVPDLSNTPERPELHEGALQPFGIALQTLFRGRGQFLTRSGNVNWREAADALDGVSYETLRKAVTGERLPGASLIDKATAAYGLPRDYFLESQLETARQQLDPRVVGWPKAASNLRRWLDATNAPEPPSSDSAIGGSP